MDDIRELALALLNDEYGVSERACGLLLAAMKAAGNCADIVVAVEAADGRFYLPADFGHLEV
jgi:hypothetical protein